jgi:hypothetical protein
MSAFGGAAAAKNDRVRVIPINRRSRNFNHLNGTRGVYEGPLFDIGFQTSASRRAASLCHWDSGHPPMLRGQGSAH